MMKRKQGNFVILGIFKRLFLHLLAFIVMRTNLGENLRCLPRSDGKMSPRHPLCPT